MNAIRRRASATVLTAFVAVLLFEGVAYPDNPFTSSPLGVQRVLVVLVQFPTTDPCPDKTTICPPPVDDPMWMVNVGPPRHTAAEWQTLLNNIATTYWVATTYNQTQFQFTVVANPNADNGWWPAPHTFQDYFRNYSSTDPKKWVNQWAQIQNNPPSYAFIPDVTRAVVDYFCFPLPINPTCLQLQFPAFNRLLVIGNVHLFGASSNANDAPLTISTGIPLPPWSTLMMSASGSNEDTTDEVVPAIIHELGHQLGILSHYGDCSSDFSYTSFNSTLPSSPLECITDWDVMGLSPSFSQLSGYSRVNRGWITPAQTASFDLVGGAPFSTTLAMNPLEIPPEAGHPNVVRLSIGDLSWPQFDGYYVECREQIGGDVFTPFPSVPTVHTIPDTGLLITNVHEPSLQKQIPFPTPAHHVERPFLPTDQLRTATLKPGQSFGDSYFGLTVRFNGYGGPELRQCSVSIARQSGSLSPTPDTPLLLFAGDAVLNEASGQLQDSASISSDVAVNSLVDAVAAVGLPIPVAPPWMGHDNPIRVRVHNRSPISAQNVQVAVGANQPAAITDTCGAGPAPPTLDTTVIPSILAASSGLADLHWTPAQNGSVSLDVTAMGEGTNQIQTSSRFAFQFHHVDTLAGGVSTEVAVAVGPDCPEAETLLIDPATSQAGWQVSATPPMVTLSPGQTASVSILVVPPQSHAGAHAEIPIAVRKPDFELGPNPGLFGPGVHLDIVGAVTILARVTGGSGSISLNVPGASAINTPMGVSGAITPPAANSPISVEYRSPSGRVFTQIVQADSASAYADSIIADELGAWTVQARWPGDDAHDPTESTPGTVMVTATSGGPSFRPR